MLNYRLLNDETRKTAVRLHRLDNRSHRDELSQTLTSVFGHRELFAQLHIDLLHLLIVCVRNVNYFAAILRKERLNMVADCLLRADLPVVTVNDVVGLDLLDYVVVHEVLLNDYLINAVELLVALDPVLE